MINRRETCLVLGSSALGLIGSAQSASSQELPSEAKSILYEMAEKLGAIATTDAVRIVYSNLVFAQLNYRIAINLNGYENAGEFQQAFAIANEVLFNDKSLILLKGGAKPPDDLIGQMIKAYDKQREQYAVMIERMLKEGGDLLSGLTPNILVQSMAYFASASAAVYQFIGDWFTKSYVFPFCVRSA